MPRLAIDPNILTIEQEVASAICARDAEGANLDPDIAKHFTVIIRKQYIPAESEAVIICAALLETGHLGLQAGIPTVQHILGLDTRDKRLEFFREYVHEPPLTSLTMTECSRAKIKINIKQVLTSPRGGRHPTPTPQCGCL